jgi:hypothetical protein
MALNRKLNFGPDEDELDVLRGKHAQLWKDFGNMKIQSEELEKQYADLKREKANIQNQKNRLQEKVRMLEEKAKADPTPPAVPRKSSIFLIIAAILVGARLLLYKVIEGWGTRAVDLGNALTMIFGVAVLVMILAWVLHESNSVGWLVAPNCVFLFVAILICAEIFDPNLLETGKCDGPVQHPGTAAAVLIFCLLFAATRLSFLAMGWLLLFVTDPRRYFKNE